MKGWMAREMVGGIRVVVVSLRWVNRSCFVQMVMVLMMMMMCSPASLLPHHHDRAPSYPAVT